jgi:hypothetical protein
LRSNGITGEHNAFEQLVGIAFHQLPVLEGAGLAFVRIAAEVPRTLIILGEEPPFNAGRETRSSATAQTGLHDDGGHIGRCRLAERFAQGLIPAGLFVLLQRAGVPRLRHIL